MGPVFHLWVLLRMYVWNEVLICYVSYTSTQQ